MSWNYRIVKRTSPLGEHFYALHEVYYKDHDINQPTARDDEARGFMSGKEEGPEGIIASLELALKSIREHPVLDDPWPDEILPHMIEKFPEPKTLAAELNGQTNVDVRRIPANGLGLRVGYLVVTGAIDGVEPRVKLQIDDGPDAESMDVSIGPDAKLLGSSLPAFFRHTLGQRLCDFVKLNHEALMYFWEMPKTNVEATWAVIGNLTPLPDDNK
jgi:hypothetical protein